MEELIRKTLQTLDKIEVRGKENIIRMHACMQTLESIAEAMRHNREEMQKAGGEAQ